MIIADAVVCGLIGIGLGYRKNQWWRGMLAGLILGPVGLLFMLAIPLSGRGMVRRAERRMQIQDEAARRAGPANPYDLPVR